MPNIYDVARAARVGEATVSAAANGTASVSPALKKRVQVAVKPLGYRIGVPITDVTSFDAYVGGWPTKVSAGTRRLGLKSVSVLVTAVGDDHSALCPALRPRPFALFPSPSALRPLPFTGSGTSSWRFSIARASRRGSSCARPAGEPARSS